MAVSYLNDAFFSRLETLALNLRPDLSGFFGGKHLVRTYGQTVEFADYREYMLGDDIRRIDWNLYSRFEKYFLKLFTDERQMHTQIFLDCSASMGKINPEKGAYAIAVAAALGFLSVHNMDKVSFKMIKEDKLENPFGTIVGKQSFFRAISALEQTAFVDGADISAAISGGIEAGRHYTVSVDLYPHLLASFERMRQEGYYADCTLSDMRISTTNIGWELPGTFDAGVEVDYLSVKYVEKG